MFYPGQEHRKTTALHDQIQIALAIADKKMLKALLTQCRPPIIQPHLVADVSVRIGVPIQYKQNADGIITFDEIQSIPATQGNVSDYDWTGGLKSGLTIKSVNDDDNSSFVRLHILKTLLQETDLSPEQVEEIFQLPRMRASDYNEAVWHESLWYTQDSRGQFTIPFLRCIRIAEDLNLVENVPEYVIQVRDISFQKSSPPPFGKETKHGGRVLVEIKTEIQSFGQVIEQIKRYQEKKGIKKAILICDTVNEFEAQGFISQGISIYPATELVLPTRANCSICRTKQCPMNGIENSPVSMCYDFIYFN